MIIHIIIVISISISSSSSSMISCISIIIMNMMIIVSSMMISSSSSSAIITDITNMCITGIVVGDLRDLAVRLQKDAAPETPVARACRVVPVDRADVGARLYYKYSTSHYVIIYHIISYHNISYHIIVTCSIVCRILAGKRKNAYVSSETFWSSRQLRVETENCVMMASPRMGSTAMVPIIIIIIIIITIIII